MAENKFTFKKSFYNVLAEMTDKQAGELIKGVSAYAFDGKPFQTKDAYLKGVFLYIKRELDVSKQNSKNGKKGGIVSAEKKQKERAMKNVGMLLGSVVVAAEQCKKNRAANE